MNCAILSDVINNKNTLEEYGWYLIVYCQYKLNVCKLHM